MKYLDEYRDPQAAHRFATAIAQTVTRPWTIMEVCGGQTRSIVKYGLESMLPESLTLVHGPGCPVCVTAAQTIDQAVELATGDPRVILCTFGDMMRVPGTGESLLGARSHGGDVRMVYSPIDAVTLARENPDREVVFFAIGFETTAPANALAVIQARGLGLRNFTLLVAQVRVPPAIEAIASSPDNCVNGFLAAGHVCTIMGYDEYEPLAEKFGIPIVVTGFEPVDLLAGVYDCVRLLEAGRATVTNQFARCVQREGNTAARRMMAEVFEVVDRPWRGIGLIPDSGLGLRPAFRDFDAEGRFGLKPVTADEAPTACISGQVLRGLKKPHECPAFGTLCTPPHPLGAPMVSSEGACASYYNFGRHAQEPTLPKEPRT